MPRYLHIHHLPLCAQIAQLKIEVAANKYVEGMVHAAEARAEKAEAGLNETWLEPIEHGPSAWRRPTAEAYARVCVLYRKAEARIAELEKKELDQCHQLAKAWDQARDDFYRMET